MRRCAAARAAARMGIVCRQLLVLLVLLLLAAGERAAAGRSRRERTLPALRTNTDGGDGDGDESAVGLLDPEPQAQGCVISAATTIVTVVCWKHRFYHAKLRMGSTYFHVARLTRNVCLPLCDWPAHLDAQAVRCLRSRRDALRRCTLNDPPPLRQVQQPALPRRALVRSHHEGHRRCGFAESGSRTGERRRHC